MAPGTTVKLDIWRDGKMQDYSLTLGELAGEDRDCREQRQRKPGGGLEGVEVQELTPEIAQQLNLRSGNPRRSGELRGSFQRRRPRRTSIGRGDVIQEINHKPIHEH